MSDNWLQFVPIDPTFQPLLEASDRARALLSSFAPKAEEISTLFYDSIQFFDPGGNWSGVECPVCGADAESWWQEAITTAAESDFVNLSVTSGCCETMVSLNELRYLWPAAFGSFVLKAMNPAIQDLSSSQQSQLEHALGCKLRKIWVHV